MARSCCQEIPFHMHIYIHTYVHAYMHTYTHTHTHTFTHTCIHTHIHIHIHIHLKRTPCSSITVSARCAFKRDLYASKETYKRDVRNAISNETRIQVKTPTKETHIRVKRPTKKTDHMTSNLQGGQAISPRCEALESWKESEKERATSRYLAKIPPCSP